MKKNTQMVSILAGLLLCFNVTIFAQSGAKEMFGSIDNTEQYQTFELAHMSPDISTFINLVALSGLESSLLMLDEHTAFIPTNDAFREMDISEFAYLTNPKNKADLIKFVKYHFLPNKVMKYEFKDSQVIDADGLNDISVAVDEPYDTVYIGGGRIIKEDIETKNGVIHIVDRAIVPSEVVDLGK